MNNDLNRRRLSRIARMLDIDERELLESPPDCSPDDLRELSDLFRAIKEPRHRTMIVELARHLSRSAP